MAMATLGQPPSSSPPTYEKILIRHGLKRQEMQRQISDDALFPIARQMTRWRSIDLGLTKGIVNAVENDPSTGEEKKQIQLLERWSESYGHEATYERLAFSFCSSSRVDLADAVCEIRKKFYLSSLPATENGKCGPLVNGFFLSDQSGILHVQRFLHSCVIIYTRYWSIRCQKKSFFLCRV